jgi:N-acyl-D-aspartate/D-glutamate deacylase
MTGRRSQAQNFTLALIAILSVIHSGSCTASDIPEILLVGGHVVDGSGTPAFPADLLIRGDRIVGLGPPGSVPIEGGTTINLAGKTLAPGFIDLHAHVTNLHEHPQAGNFLRQGITTTVNSLHSHDQPWPLDQYAATLRTAPNVAYFAGHTWIRKQVMGLDDRAPTGAELDEMRALVEQSMLQGALGLSTGLEYVPAVYAETEEVIELARVAARYGGMYNSHMRDEGPRIIEALAEAIRIGREADIPVHINHHKLAGSAQFGWSTRTLAMIDSARSAGLDITHDLYPYGAFSTYSDILFPAWALAGGDKAFAKRIRNPESRERIEAEMKTIFPQQTGGTFESVQFRGLPGIPGFEGRTLADLLDRHGHSRELESAIDVLIDLQLAGGFIGIFHSMSEEDIERIMAHPWSMIESDGDLVEHGEGYPHPRSYGSFPRVLARYVRERGTISLEQAIHKMTAMPAARIGASERGLIKPGMYADIIVFDPASIQDLSTYADPHHYSTGIEHLFINGVAVIQDGDISGALPGKVLRGPGQLARTPQAH